MCLGLYFIVVNVAVPAIDIRFPEWRLEYRVNEYFKTIVVSVLLIGGGVKLMTGSKNNKGRKGAGGQS